MSNIMREMAMTAQLLFEFANHLKLPNHVFNGLGEVTNRMMMNHSTSDESHHCFGTAN